MFSPSSVIPFGAADPTTFMPATFAPCRFTALTVTRGLFVVVGRLSAVYVPLLRQIVSPAAAAVIAVATFAPALSVVVHDPPPPPPPVTAGTTRTPAMTAAAAVTVPHLEPMNPLIPPLFEDIVRGSAQCCEHVQVGQCSTESVTRTPGIE